MLYLNRTLLSSNSTNWGGLYLQYHCQPPFEMAEHSCQQHRLIIHDRTLEPPILQAVGKLRQRKPVSRGMIMVLPANIQSWAHWQAEHQFMVLTFEAALLTQHIAETIDARSVELLPTLSHYDPLIHGIGLALKTELESGGVGGRLYVDAMKTALMAHLLRHYSVQNSSSPSINSGLSKYVLQQVVEYIQKHLDQDLTLAKLAAIAQLSPSYFSSLFKQSTGLSPHQYVIRCRIDHAKQLLLTRELSIAEIAYCLGFTHQSHFSYHFKRLVGSSPKAFLKSQ